jgi:hypothetical protein
LFFSILMCLGSASAALAQGDTYSPGKARDKTPAKAPSDLKKEGEGLFGTPKATTSAPGSADWSIVIKAFREDDQAEAARDGLRKVQSEGGLPGAYLDKRGEATVIAYGRYADPAAKDAQADLAKVHNIEVVMNGAKSKPFAAAFLAPPEEVKGSLPEFDLRNARKNTGEWVLYTLQIGVYGRGDGKAATAAELQEFRATAEKAVAQLRREGEQAFYYHGPNLSSVTVGLFGKDDFDSETKVESPALHLLRQKFPYNLQNGLGIKQRLTATNQQTGKTIKAEQLQKSCLMVVPK